jgi:hypothetical protein
LFFIYFTNFTPATTLAQSDLPEVDPIREVQVGNCQGTNEVRYHSQKLRSPDGKKTVYYDGILRRIGKRGDRLDGGGCFPLGSYQTPKTDLSIESSTGTKRIGSSPEGGFIVMEPRSFSTDGRYLVVSVDIGHEGGDGESHVLLLDSQNRYQPLSIDICNGHIYQQYKGFISASELIIECVEADEYQVVNLNRRAIRKVSQQFVNSANLQSYGTVLAPLTIVKKQTFPRR